jgi:carbamoyltransferase
MPEYVLGLHIGHDASAALLRDGELVYAEEEERLAKHKNYFGFPTMGIANALAFCGIRARDVKSVAVGWEANRLMNDRLALAKNLQLRGHPVEALRKRSRASDILRHIEFLPELFPDARVLQIDHHAAHASSVVPFSRPGVELEGVPGLVMDGLGEDCATSVFGSTTNPESAVLRLGPGQSIGLFYQRWAEAIGFRGWQAPGYLMALSRHGNPQPTTPWLDRQFLTTTREGFPRLKDGSFDPTGGRGDSAIKCFLQAGSLPIEFSAESTPWDLRDLAAGIQDLTERLIVGLVEWLVQARSSRRVTLSGGVFLNCLALGRIRRELPDVELILGPAPKDCGVAVGAAVQAHASLNGHSNVAQGVGAYLGTDVRGDPFWEMCLHNGLGHVCTGVDALARDLAAGRVVAVVDDRLEFGPRALGARSILAAADQEGMAEKLNAVKGRYPFQPFAGSMARDVARALFGLATPEPFMTSAYAVRSDARPVTQILNPHDECRLHVVDETSPSLLRRALEECRRAGREAVLINTSLNAKAEPLAATAEDALETFRRLELDVLYGPHGFRLERDELHERARS